MLKKILVGSLLSLISLSALAFENELKRVLERCEFTELLSVAEKSNNTLVDYRSTGYEGYGCEFSVVDSTFENQTTRYLVRLCGDMDTGKADELHLFYTADAGSIAYGKKILSFYERGLFYQCQR